jgi:hypothetical protein
MQKKLHNIILKIIKEIIMNSIYILFIIYFAFSVKENKFEIENLIHPQI